MPIAWCSFFSGAVVGCLILIVLLAWLGSKDRDDEQ